MVAESPLEFAAKLQDCIFAGLVYGQSCVRIVRSIRRPLEIRPPVREVIDPGNGKIGHFPLFVQTKIPLILRQEHKPKCPLAHDQQSDREPLDDLSRIVELEDSRGQTKVDRVLNNIQFRMILNPGVYWEPSSP